MNNDYNVGVYIRLSKEDSDKSLNRESESIKNQRKLIYNYLKENKLNLYKEYVDDGYTGTNFDRPGFNSLIKDIQDGKINMIITKDLSRLGRDYIKTGYYVEEYFPMKKVRYVSLLDGVDTYKNTNNNDIAPFKALFNDMVSKDTSKKIKSILKTKKERGLFLGSRAPYGYKKDPLNKNKLIIDEKTSKIVKKIFKLSLDGKSNQAIAEHLNKQGVSSPSNSEWSSSSVYNILNNKEYTGCLVSNVWTSISYKNKTRIKRSQSEWIIIHNTHEKIIDKKIFDLIKKKKNQKRKKTFKMKENLLLDGKIYCEDCGSKMGISYLKNRGYYVLNCNKYKKNAKKCFSHYIKYKDLENRFLEYIDTKEKLEDYKVYVNSNRKLRIVQIIDE
ncbi:MAG: recombinase family protein [Bacilli bacterium]|nr:recombinase family protein [Bacilli bacterium]